MQYIEDFLNSVKPYDQTVDERIDELTKKCQTQIFYGADSSFNLELQHLEILDLKLSLKYWEKVMIDIRFHRQDCLEYPEFWIQLYVAEWQAHKWHSYLTGQIPLLNKYRELRRRSDRFFVPETYNFAPNEESLGKLACVLMDLYVVWIVAAHKWAEVVDAFGKTYLEKSKLCRGLFSFIEYEAHRSSSSTNTCRTWIMEDENA